MEASDLEVYVHFFLQSLLFGIQEMPKSIILMVFAHSEILFVLSCLYFRQACENALVDKHMHKISQMGNDETTSSYLEDLETLTEVFSKATEFDTPTEVRELPALHF